MNEPEETDPLGGEPTAEEVRDWREALARRLDKVRQARARGELLDADWADLERLSEHLAILRDEELIAEFVETGLIATWRRAELLARLGERADG